MSNLEPINIIAGLTPDKHSVENAIQQITEALDDGDGDVFKFAAQLNALKQVVDGTMKAIQPHLEQQLFGEKNYVKHGATFNLAERKNWRFDHCTAFKEADAKLKAIKKVMQSIPSEMADPETGEVLQPAVEKSRTTTVRITLPNIRL